MPEALSLLAAYRKRRVACGQTYCTFAGTLTVPRRVGGRFGDVDAEFNNVRADARIK